MDKLENIPLFQSLPDAELRALAAKTVTKSFGKNVIVINEGEFSQAFYVILAGKVKVYLSDRNGKELLLFLRGPGQYFGEMMLDDGPRPASVVTLEPCQFAVIPGPDFRKLLVAHPDIALSVILNLIQAARGLTDSVRGRAMDVYGRVSRMLLALAVERKGTLIIPEKLTQQEIASRVGTSREVINRILRDLTVGGYIGIKARTITIHKPLPAQW